VGILAGGDLKMVLVKSKVDFCLMLYDPRTAGRRIHRYVQYENKGEKKKEKK